MVEAKKARRLRAGISTVAASSACRERAAAVLSALQSPPCSAQRRHSSRSIIMPKPCREPTISRRHADFMRAASGVMTDGGAIAWYLRFSHFVCILTRLSAVFVEPVPVGEAAAEPRLEILCLSIAHRLDP